MTGLVLSLLVAHAAPDPQPELGSAYLPTLVGAEAVYRCVALRVVVQGGPKGALPAPPTPSKVVVRVTAVEQRNGETLITLAETSNGMAQGSDTFVVSAKGVFNIRTTGAGAGGPTWQHDPPICVLKLPHKAGTEWVCDNPAQPGGLVAVEAKKTAHGPEEVEVPAGKFEAIRVEHKSKFGDATFWYAPGVGMVKMVTPDGVQELESFKPGRK